MAYNPVKQLGNPLASPVSKAANPLEWFSGLSKGAKAPKPSENPLPSTLQAPLEWDKDTKATRDALIKASQGEGTVYNTTIDKGASDQSRAFQMAQAQRLQDLASGQGPSFADLQLQQARQGNVAAAMSLAASARGTNRALAGRQAQMQAGSLNANAAMESAMARIKEQQMAEQALAAASGAMRGQDINLAQSQGQIDLATRLKQAELNDAAIARSLRAQEQIYGADVNRQMQGRGFDVDLYKAALQRESAKDQVRSENYKSMMQGAGSIMQGAGSAMSYLGVGKNLGGGAGGLGGGGGVGGAAPATSQGGGATAQEGGPLIEDQPGSNGYAPSDGSTFNPSEFNPQPSGGAPSDATMGLTAPRARPLNSYQLAALRARSGYRSY